MSQKDTDSHLPEPGLRVLKYILPQRDADYLIGNYQEDYTDILTSRGKMLAWLWFWMQIIYFAPVFLKNRFIWSMSMFANYLKIALRNLVRYKAYTFINVSGLSIGIACCLVIMLYVNDELGYDAYHAKTDRIKRLNMELYYPSGAPSNYWAITSVLWGPTMKRDYPEVEDFVRIQPGWNEWTVSVGSQNFPERSIAFTDASVFDIFSWELIEGDTSQALTEVNTVVISETAAKKYFGRTDLVGEAVLLDQNQFDRSGNKVSQPTPFTITGIMRDIPRKTQFRPDFLVSMVSQNASIGGDVITGSGLPSWRWRNRSMYTYLLLAEGATVESLEAKFSGFLDEYPINSETLRRGYGYRIYLQNITDMHYETLSLIGEQGRINSKTTLYTFSVIALFLLFIACTNFTNLATARSVNRAREVGMRKVVGAKRSQLIKQFLGESIVVSLFSLVVASLLALYLLPKFYQYVNKEFLIESYNFWILTPIMLTITIAVGLAAGGYPAFFISAFKPVGVLKKSFRSFTKGSYLRKGLVISQFTISVFLIVATLTVIRQLHFMRTTDPGFNSEQILVLPGTVTSKVSNYDIFKSELLTIPGVERVAFSSVIPGRLVSRKIYVEVDKPSNAGVSLTEFWVDQDFMEIYGLEVIAGRIFGTDVTSDYSGLNINGITGGTSILLNEAAVDALQLGTPEEAIGKRLIRDPNSYEFTGPIIGVVKDFHFQSLHNEVAPMAMVVAFDYRYTSIKLSSQNIPAAVEALQGKVDTILPGTEFSYYFLDEDFNRFYQSEERLGRIFGYVSGLAIVIACMGLFGLAAFMVESRAKEIGIRKVLGSSVNKILLLLAEDFVKLLLVANTIALPGAYFVMTQWLTGFAYRIHLSWGLFLAAAGMVMVIALLTVGYQVLRASLANPINSLRDL